MLDSRDVFVARDEVEFDLATSPEPITLQAAGPPAGGFWVPMGWTRRGPAMSAYDEFLPLSTPAGDTGFGMIEHGIVRNLF